MYQLKFYWIFTLLCTLNLVAFGQKNEMTITGKVIENASQQPVEFATIMIGDPETKKAITGTTTDLDGNFEVTTKATNFYVEISFIGYAAKQINDFTPQNGKVNLGTITLFSDSQVLSEVEVRAEKSTTEFKLDKRVFNVGKDLSSTGASALEVLNNVPSVDVNIEGEISLRGSGGVQVLINGKPSVIASEQGNALGTITADMIEKVEVITNPSAKYEAEGTSGIINIVIKKEERKGINGSATVNVGVPHNHSFGLSLNRRTEKLNLFSQLGIGYRELPNDVERINRNLINNTAVLSEGREFRNENFYNFIIGTDYYIDKNNVITLSGSFAYEIEDQPSNTNFRFEDASGDVVDRWEREEVTEATNPKYQYELQYKRDFDDDEDHTLLFSAIGNLFSKDQSSEFFNTTISGRNRTSQQRTRTDFGELRQTFQLDYTKPFKEKWTLETGALFNISDVENDFAVTDWVNDQWVDNPNLTNVFEYHQDVLGIYGSGSYEGDIWGFKAGLRAENTNLRTFLVNTNERNEQQFLNLFPSAFVSFKSSPNLSFQAGYSRRIFRPRLWNLNPFFNIRNDFSIRTGNPDLLPEFTDVYELTSIYIIGQLSLNAGIYYRYTTDVVERIATLQDNVSFTQPFNIGTNRTTGVEFNFKYPINKKWTMNGDANYNRFNREGDFEGTSFDFTADRWSAKWRNKFQLPADFDFEVTTQYRSRFQTVQGLVTGFAFADLGVRKKIMDGKGVINFSVRDIFATRIRESEATQPGFFLYNFNQRGRFITLGFSYGFGKGEAMAFGAQKRF
ncbi:MAG: outer membrane beta-barrel family protein [Bacteroidota bacterium]